jgi:hypothetical protein
VTGWWFSPGPPVSSTNKTDCHDITEKLLKVALNTIKPNQTKFVLLLLSIIYKLHSFWPYLIFTGSFYSQVSIYATCTWVNYYCYHHSIEGSLHSQEVTSNFLFLTVKFLQINFYCIIGSNELFAYSSYLVLVTICW